MTVDEQVVSRGATASASPSTSAAGRRRSAMRARACLSTQLRGTPEGRRRSSVSTLRSDAPLLLRPLPGTSSAPGLGEGEDAVRVALVAGAGGPVGGDRLSLHITVGEGSRLVLSQISPTLLLPGPRGERSCLRVRVRVACAATLVWLPEPLVAVCGCDHLSHVLVDLDEGARLLMREELLLGRHGEQPGRVLQSVTVRLGGRTLYRQDLGVGGPDASAPGVVGRRRAVGSLLVVDPSWVGDVPEGEPLGGEAAVLRLQGPAAVVTAVGSDNLVLRQRLQSGLRAIGPPWAG